MTRIAMAEAELEALFRRHLDMVYRYCWLSLGELEADDAASEVFIVAWEKAGGIPPAARRAWLLGVARGVVANRLRAGRNRTALAKRYLSESDHFVPDPAETVAGVDRLRTALLALRRADREVLALAAMAGLSQAEMGQALGCSAKAAGIRLSRARARLSHALDQDQGREAFAAAPSANAMHLGVKQ